MAIPAKNTLGNPNVTEGNFQVAIEQLRESVIGSGKAYDSANTYMQYDTCVYNGVTYYSKINSNTGNTPSIGTNWGDVADLINGVVHKTGNETIAGVKTFSSSPIVPNATTATQAMAYGQGVNLTAAQTIAGVKTFSSSPIVPNATTATQAIAYGQAVKNTGNETIAGVKTFSSSPIVPNATTATQAMAYGQGVNLTAAQTIAGVKTFTDGLKLQGQNVSPFSGFKNYIINGNFGVWQRGTNFTGLTNGSYSVDRWVVYDSVCDINYNVIRNAGVLQGGYGAQYTWNSGTGLRSIIQFIENVTRFKVGAQFTVSFEAYTNSAPYDVAVCLQGVRGVWSSATPMVSQTISLTNSKTRYSVTLAVPDWTSLGIDWAHLEDTKLALKFDFGADTNGKNFVFSNVQLEEGSVATPFEQRPYGLELSLCQRYYEKIDRDRCNIPVYGTGSGFLGVVNYKVQKRTSPSVSFGTASHWRTIVIYNGIALSTLNAQEITASSFEVSGTSSGGSIQAGYAGKVQVNDGYTDNGTDGIFVSAEL